MGDHQHDWNEVRRVQGSRPGIWIVTYQCGICMEYDTKTERD